MNDVQSYIANISFPTSLDELYGYGGRYNVEQILGVLGDADWERGAFCENDGWTAPRWAKQGDIVFFFHSKTANARISHLVTELTSKKEEFCANDYWYMMNSLNRAKMLWRAYGGKIFAIGRVSGAPYVEKDYVEEDRHWKSNIYAAIDSIFVLEKPINISEFNEKIMVSRQGSITPVFGEAFDYLKSLIVKKNKYVREFFLDSVSQPIPLAKVTAENWLSVTNPYRRSFILEAQLRAYYVDYLLPLLGDRKKVYRECRCWKKGSSPTWVDNVIHWDSKYFPVEVKLNIDLEKDLAGQLEQYIDVDTVDLSKDKTINGSEMLSSVMVIDTEGIYVYEDGALDTISSLDNLHNINDVQELKLILKAYMNAEYLSED